MKNGAENPLLHAHRSFSKMLLFSGPIQLLLPVFASYLLLNTFLPFFSPNSMFDWVSQVTVVVKNPPAIAGDVRDTGLLPGSRRSPGGGHGNPLQYSCLENPMDREDWQTTVHSVAELDTTEKTWHACMQYASKVWQG